MGHSASVSERQKHTEKVEERNKSSSMKAVFSNSYSSPRSFKDGISSLGPILFIYTSSLVLNAISKLEATKLMSLAKSFILNSKFTYTTAYSTSSLGLNRYLKFKIP